MACVDALDLAQVTLRLRRKLGSSAYRGVYLFPVSPNINLSVTNDHIVNSNYVTEDHYAISESDIVSMHQLGNI